MDLTAEDSGQRVRHLLGTFFGKTLLQDYAPGELAVLYQVANAVAGVRRRPSLNFHDLYP